ncbi:hypothetical protein K9Z21_004489, partial [Salmonella enterica]|nr:hypothetical protein [Salmonella enterica]EIX2892226.1 hypothetical protein [Salmonella enterica]
MSVFDKNDVVYFPEKITYDFDYQKKHFWRCRYTSASLKGLHYKILLPLTVRPIIIEPTSVDGLEGVNIIGSYQTIPEYQSSFMEVNVVYGHIKNDIDASDWLDKILSLLGEKIIHRKNNYSVSGKYSDVLTNNELDGDKIISRIRVFKNYDFEHKGANLIMVKASCPHKDYESLAEDFLHCVKFFTLINDSKWHLAEELKSINLDVPANYSFFYPRSWQYIERYNNERMSYFSLSLAGEGKAFGRINGYFLCHDATINKETVCSLIVENLKDDKYSTMDEIHLNEERNIFNNNISELWSGTFSVSDEQNRNGELVVSAGRIENAWFYF